MRLLIATPLYPPEIGGPATYAHALAEGLPSHGTEVEVVKFSDVRHLPRLIRHYAYYRRVLKAARAADAVLALDPVSTGLPAMRAAKKARKPFVVKIVGDYAWEQGRQRFGVTANLDEFVKLKMVPMRVKALRKIQTRVALGAAKIIVPSEYLKNIVMQWDVPGEKIEVIYNAVPMEALGKVPESVAALPRPLVVTAGRLVAWKNIGGIIDALRQVPNASLAIVGDGPLKHELEQSAHKLGARVVMTGRLAHPDMLAVIKSADIFVLNSSYEGLSHLLIEAQALGVPTIATRVGGNPEVIQEGDTGILVTPEESRSLVEALNRLLGDASMRARLSARAIESSRRFSEEAMLAATAALLAKLV